MTPDEIKALIDSMTKKVTTLDDLIRASQTGNKEAIEACSSGVATIKTDVGELLVKFEKHENWVTEVQASLDKARRGGGDMFSQSDALKDAIPERFRANIEAYGRMGNTRNLVLPQTKKVTTIPNDAVFATAVDDWMKNTAKLQVARYSTEHARCMEENDKLSKALGDADFYGPGANESKAADSPFATTPDAQGGFLVPTPVEAFVLRIVEDAGVVRPQARVMPMTVHTHKIPDDASGITVGVVGEATTIPEQEPTFGTKSLIAKMIAVRGLESLQIMNDSSIGLMDYWLERAAESYALFEDAEALEGDGTNFTGLSDATNVNEILAVLTIAGGVTTNGGPPHYKQLVEAVYKAGKRSTRRAGAVWYMHANVLRNIINQEDGSGVPKFNRQDVARVLSQNIVGPGFGEGTLLGYPVWTTDQISIARTKGSLTTASNIYFGPMFDGILIGDLLGLQFAVSEHVKFHEAQLSMRLLKRTAILTAIPAAVTRLINIDAS